VVGLTFSGTGGRIIVAAHARFNRISDLRGKKIALPRRADTDRIDFWRATAERGILLALELNGLSGNDVEIVELISHGAGFLPPKPAQKPLDAFDAAQVNVVSGAEVEALFTGEVDAIYADFGRAKILEGEGKVKAIEDLGHYPDWTLQVANTPHTITVSADLAENNPEIVVAYLKAAIRGGRWINENHAEAGRLFANVTSYRCPIGAARVLDGYNFVPNLTGRSIAGIEVEKRFLLDHGYIENDFDVHQWVDRSFLEQALALLDGQVGTGTSPCRAEPACTAL
jgi:ABC-type nitrate/sulfonate/bicarbonate transport system substrate-binding protein